MPSVNIPFAGFYYSKWSDMIDNAESMDNEHFEDTAQSEPDHELYCAEPAARLDGPEIADLQCRHSSYGAAYAAIARDYAAGFNDELSDKLGFKQSFTFEEMTSPREYNFETDRLFCDVPIETVKAWLKISRRADNHKTLAATFKRRFTSRDGFSSFYEPIIPRKPVDEWDHNELGTLLQAVMELRVDDADELEWSIYYPMAERDYEYANLALDWPAFVAAVREAQEDKLAELKADPDYVEPPYRCPDTPDMFAGA